MSESITRKLTTIMAADAQGFSSAMSADEDATYADLNAARDVFHKLIDRHRGRIANTAGDGLIAEFQSVVEAVQCAIETQQELGARKSGLQYRIGIHLGDVIVDGDDLIGEGVNLAARLESMAEPGGVLISQQVYDQVHAKLSIGFEYLGERRPKNLSEDVPVYRIDTGTGQKSETPRTFSFSKKPAEPEAPARPSPPASQPLDINKYVKLLALFSVAFLAIDLATGPGFWAHWPILAFAATAAMAKASEIAPFTPFSAKMLRAFIPAVALVLINLFSWNGAFWAIWPIGIWILVYVGNRIRSGSG